MNDPRRLLEDPNVSAGAKDLLGSLEPPAPLSGAARSAIGTRVTNSLVAPAAAAKVLSLKAIGLLVGAVFVGGAGALTFTFVAPSKPNLAEIPQRREAKSQAAEREPERATEPTPPVTDPIATDEPAPAPKATPGSARPASRRDTLALEESLLEQARRSIDSPAQALPLLREHERRFPNGELTAERLYLTAQAHVRAGNRVAARRYAALLAQRFPKSTYLPRVRPLLEGGSQ